MKGEKNALLQILYLLKFSKILKIFQTQAITYTEYVILFYYQIQYTYLSIFVFIFIGNLSAAEPK